MIARLKGIVDFRDDPYLLIDVSGVGYKVLATSSVLQDAKLGEQATIYTYTYVREDALDLYGFSTMHDLKLFEQLIGVSGVGPKTAIGIFSIGSSATIISAIATGDVDFFTSVPRLGKKNAQKLIIELKNKVGGIGEISLGEGGVDSHEVITALLSFGFTQNEAREALQYTIGKAETTEEKVRVALKYLGK